MALLHTFRGQLPEDRVELYQWAIDLLLRRWEARVSGEDGLLEKLDLSGLKMNDLEAGLYDVAYHVHAGAGEGETADVAEGILRERIAPYLNSDWNKAGIFVAHVRERAGLLIRHKPDAYTFPHRTFREFMAACRTTSIKRRTWRTKIRSGGGSSSRLPPAMLPGPISWPWRFHR